MKHPNEVQLALFAGGDLGFWDRWLVRRHVARCSGCESEVHALRATSGQVRELAAELPRDLNKDMNWDRLADEMTGNIRVGLAAGEAIARFDRPVRIRPARLGWTAALAVSCATLIFGVAFWTSVPQPQKDHLLSALRRVGAQRVATVEGVVLEASSASIEVQENGRTMSLMHPRSDAVTVSVSMRGSAGVRYVDADSGQVTTNKVYYAEQ